MIVADNIASGLVGAGVRRVYGYPGEDHMALLAALDRAGLEYVLAGSETSACIMASAEAVASGVPGVAVVSFAPGLTNAINGIASAFMDRTPLLVFAGQHPASRRSKIVRQNLDNHEIVRGVVKGSLTIGQSPASTLEDALSLALTVPPGPIFVELPEEVALQEIVADASSRPAVESSEVTPSGDVDAVRDLLSDAQYPVLLLGRTEDARAGEWVSDLASATRMLMFTSPSAKGLVANDDTWLAGTFLHGNPEDEILTRADLILAVNLSARDFLNRAWEYECPVVWIGEQPYNEGYLPVSTSLVGPPGLLASMLHPRGPVASRWADTDGDNYRAQLRSALGTDLPGLHISRALDVIRQASPPEVRITVDAGFGKPLASLLWEPEGPNAYFSSHGLSTMGYALPAAVGVHLATGDPVLALMGDGSFLMRMADVTTAVERRLPIVCVVWVDGLLAQINIKQHRRGLPAVGTVLPSLDVGAIGWSLGAKGHDVHTIEDLELALRGAFERQGPTVIGAHVGTEHQQELFEVIRG